MENTPEASEMMQIEAKKLQSLLATKMRLEADVKTLYYGCMSILAILGIAEDGKLKPECFGPDANPLPEVIREGGHILSLAIQSQVPIIGKKAEAKLQEKFKFYNELLPVFEFYEAQYNQA